MLARNSTSLGARGLDSFGSKCSKTLSSVSMRLARVEVAPYSPRQKNVLPPATRSTSSVIVAARAQDLARLLAEVVADRADDAHLVEERRGQREVRRRRRRASARARRTGVLTASKASDPTTVTLMGRAA